MTDRKDLCYKEFSVVSVQVLHANLATSRHLKHHFFDEDVMVLIYFLLFML